MSDNGDDDHELRQKHERGMKRRSRKEWKDEGSVKRKGGKAEI